MTDTRYETPVERYQRLALSAERMGKAVDATVQACSFHDGEVWHLSTDEDQLDRDLACRIAGLAAELDKEVARYQVWRQNKDNPPTHIVAWLDQQRAAGDPA